MKEEYIDISEFVPISVSVGFSENRKICKTQQDFEIWDAAIKECIKSIVLTCGSQAPQIFDLQWLLFNQWEWNQDKQFVDELKKLKTNQ